MIQKPAITIAICTYNRAGYLEDTLKDLHKQSAASDDFEVLVVNNNSTDHTDEVCRNFAETHSGISFRRVLETEQGLSFARNRAAKESGSEAILFIDDDVHLPEKFIESALNYLNKHPEVQCAGGRIFVSFDEGEPDWIPAELMPMFGLHDLGDSDKTYPSANYPRGGNMLIKKEVFRQYGKFNPNLGRIGNYLFGSEEKEFFERVRKEGVVLNYWRGLKLWHRIGPDRLQKPYLRKQSVGIGRSERRRMGGSVLRTAAKFSGEMVKLTGSVLLSLGYLIRGKPRAAGFLLLFRVWVLKGFVLNDRVKGF